MITSITAMATSIKTVKRKLKNSIMPNVATTDTSDEIVWTKPMLKKLRTVSTSLV